MILRILVFCSLFFLLAESSYANDNNTPKIKTFSLEDAMKAHLVTASFIGNGGYCGKGLNIKLRNISCDEIKVDVPPALIFRPSDDKYQDLVIASGFTFQLKPDAAQETTFQTFCARAPGNSPEASIRFNYWKRADNQLSSVISFIHDRSIYDNLGQYAVWCMTDDHNVNSIYNPAKPDLSKELAYYVADIKHVKRPDFFKLYKISNTPGLPAFLPKPTKAVVDMNWDFETPRNLKASIWRADGTVFRAVAGKEVIKGKSHRMHVVMDFNRVPRGNYYVRLRDDDNRVYQEKLIVID